MKDYTPKIVLFCCGWNTYTATGLADTSGLADKPNVRIIRTMCSGKIEPTFILQAFAQGVDGVIIAGCQHGDCHYNSGNYKARRRLMLLKKTLPQLGIEPERLEMEWVSASEAPKFQDKIDGFINKVAGLGPLGINTISSKEAEQVGVS